MKKLIRIAVTVTVFLFVWLVVYGYLNNCTGIPDSQQHHVISGESAYLASQTFFANLDSEKFRPKAGACNWANNPGNPVLLVASLIPWMLVIAAVFAFGKQIFTGIRLLWLRTKIYLLKFACLLFSRGTWKSNIILIVGLGEKGLALVNGFLNDTSRKFRVIVIELDDENPNIELARNAGALVWIGDARNRTDLELVLARYSSEIYIQLGNENDDLNVGTLCEIRNLIESHFSDDEKNSFKGAPTIINAHVSNIYLREGMLSTEIINRDNSLVWTKLINFHSDVASLMFHKSISFHNAKSNPVILVIGAGAIGTALIRHIIGMAHLRSGVEPEHRVHLHIVDRDQKAIDEIYASMPFLDKERFLNRYSDQPQKRAIYDKILPLLYVTTSKADLFEWTFDEYAQESGKWNHKPISNCFVCLDSDLANIAVANKLAAWGKQRVKDGTHSLKPLAIVTESSHEEWAKMKKGSNQFVPEEIEAFSLYDCYQHDALEILRMHERMAMFINGVYGKLDAEDACRNAWTLLLEKHRDSCLAFAQHIHVKLSELRWKIIPSDSSMKPTGGDLPPELNELRGDIENNIRALVETEHRRWVAEKLLGDYRYSEIKDEPPRLHCDIRHFDDIETQEKDKNLVLHIPKILSACGLSVKRLP